MNTALITCNHRLLCLVFILLSLHCTRPPSHSFLSLLEIPGVNDHSELKKADSLFIGGQLDQAAEIFKRVSEDADVSLYCIARLAQIDYYKRILYGHEYSDIVDTYPVFRVPDNAIDSFLYQVAVFYSKETLIDSNFIKLQDRMGEELGHQHYLYHLGDAVLGEYYYTMAFDDFLLDYYFKKHKTWCQQQPQKFYDYYWTIIRLTSSGTYQRDHLQSLAECNELVELKEWQPIMDSVHLAYAYSTRGYITFRMQKYESAYEDNIIAAGLAAETKAVPVYQEALKGMLTVTNFWGQDSLWQLAHASLKENINATGHDYANYNRHVARLLHERGRIEEAIPYHHKAIDHVLQATHTNQAVLNSLCAMISEEYEDLGEIEKAFAIYRLADVGYEDHQWTYESLLDTSLLNQTYYYYSLTHYGHLYYSWYKLTGNIEYLDKAEQLGLMAKRYYYQNITAREENQLLVLASDKNRFLELLCMINADRYFKHGDPDGLHGFLANSEENRGAIFWKDVRSEWKYDTALVEILLKEQQWNAELKRIQSANAYDQKALTNALDTISAIHRYLKEVYPDYYARALKKENPGMEEIQDSLRSDNSSLLAFDFIEDKIYVLWLTGCEMDLFEIQFPSERGLALDTLFEWMSTQNDISAGRYGKLAYEIYSWLIPDRVKNDTTLRQVIIPDGQLHKINPEALVTRMPEDTVGYEDLQYLQYSKVIVNSPLIKSYLHRRSPSEIKDQNIVVFAWSDRESIVNKNENPLTELPGTIEEVKRIKAEYPKAKIRSGYHATLKEFKKLYSHPDTKVLQISMHGVASSDKMDDLQLYFRNGKNGVDTLFGYELLELNSQASVVVLSSCQTGIGHSVSGEGNFNLSRYFLMNGANIIIANRWEMNDNKILMYRFADDLSIIMEPALNSKYQIIRSKSSPFTWAFFVGII